MARQQAQEVRAFLKARAGREKEQRQMKQQLRDFEGQLQTFFNVWKDEQVSELYRRRPKDVAVDDYEPPVNPKTEKPWTIQEAHPEGIWDQYWDQYGKRTCRSMQPKTHARLSDDELEIYHHQEAMHEMRTQCDANHDCIERLIANYQGRKLGPLWDKAGRLFYKQRAFNDKMDDLREALVRGTDSSKRHKIKEEMDALRRNYDTQDQPLYAYHKSHKKTF